MTSTNGTVSVRGPWDPLSPEKAAALLAEAEFPWWIAGGYAIELAVDVPYREHSDLDVLVLRRDQALVRRHFEAWDLFSADPPGAGSLRVWPVGEDLPNRVHDVWCRPSPDQPWSVQLMFDEADGGEWVSRRDARVRRPLAQLGRATSTGIPYLSPEVQLFYKAKDVRAKDELDFERTLLLLDADQRGWLVDALEMTMPGHAWLTRLSTLGRR
ncbi:nucleotidyltransferase domain-containing protein [Actinomadura harenae]|uniref:nucleotidyltransferase domain-containing protein n=1 Tax=Actinomadura harenae TaxID=2483351 RepID=UPI001F358270|nr:amino acid transporter [Actinomadura harenae]